MKTMKNIFFPLLLVVLFSCQSVEPDKVETLTGLAATLENQEETRTALSYSTGGGSWSYPVVLWNNYDRITLISSGGNSAVFYVPADRGGGTSTYFKGTLSPAIYPLYGIYPSKNGGTLSEGKIHFSLPRDNEGAGNAYECIPSIGYIPNSRPGNIVFYNFCGLFRLQLKGNVQIKTIVLHSLDEDEVLWGEVALTVNENLGNPATWEYTLSNEAEDKNTLWAKRAEAYPLPSEGFTNFYFTIPPGGLSSGVSVDFYDENDDLIITRTSHDDLTVSRSKIKSMSILTLTQ